MNKISASLSLSLLTAALMLPGNSATAHALHKAQTGTQTPVRPVQNQALDFTLVNQTGYQIRSLYLSPSAEDNWGENILTEVLGDGEAVDIQFSPDADAIKWDLRADWVMEEGADQEYVYWKGLKLTEISKLTLKYDPKTDKTSAVIE